MNRVDGLAAALLLAVNLALHWRIFLPGMNPYPGSIERGYAYMARMFAADPNPWSWNPLQYAGLAARFVYVPLLPYWNALWIRLLGGADAMTVHRATCALALCAGAASVYVLVRHTTGGRRAALLAGLAVTFCSPLYRLVSAIDHDRGFQQVPWRVQVLLKYGEGPHTVGLMLIPLVLVALDRAARRRSFGALWLAAAGLAAVVLTNWVAGLALAILVVLHLACYAGDGAYSVRRVLGAGLLGYLLAAFWLTPGFVFQMAGNWPKDAFGYHLNAGEELALGAWVLGLAALAVLLRRVAAGQRYLAFLTLATTAFGGLTAVFYRYGLDIIPESRRYAIEYELFLLLLAAELARLGLERPRYRWATAFLLLCGLLEETPQVTRFLSHGYAQWQPRAKEESVGYRIATELSRRAPHGRVFATGSTRFQLNSWFDLAQVGGVFETGLRNRVPVDLAYGLRTGLKSAPDDDAVHALLALRALAVEYVVVHGPRSNEYYRDIRNPEKFEGVLERVWTEGDDRIYRVSGSRYAHLMRPAERPPHIGPSAGAAALGPYVEGMRDPDRPELAFRWINRSAARIEGTFPAGYAVAVAVNADPGWEAWQASERLPIETSGLGFLTITSRPGSTGPIDLRFRATPEAALGAGLSLAAWGYCLWRLRRERHG